MQRNKKTITKAIILVYFFCSFPANLRQQKAITIFGQPLVIKDSGNTNGKADGWYLEGRSHILLRLGRGAHVDVGGGRDTVGSEFGEHEERSRSLSPCAILTTIEYIDVVRKLLLLPTYDVHKPPLSTYDVHKFLLLPTCDVHKPLLLTYDVQSC